MLQLLCYDRGSALKRAYRYVLDGFEEWSTGCASLVLVNSSKYCFPPVIRPAALVTFFCYFCAEFTAQIYADTFKNLAVRSQPQVCHSHSNWLLIQSITHAVHFHATFHRCCIRSSRSYPTRSCRWSPRRSPRTAQSTALCSCPSTGAPYWSIVEMR